MDPLFEESLVLQSGSVAPDGTVLVIALEEERAQLKIPHAHIVISSDNGWKRIVSVDYDCVRISPTEKNRLTWMVLGATGEFISVSGRGTAKEGRLYPLAKPGTMGLMRSIRTTSNSIYAVGMRRQVFSLGQSDTWSDIRGEIIHWPKSGPVVGFESIDGFSEDEIYTVGWEGEIAWRRNGHWQRVGSPTNLILTGVSCGTDGFVYACGQRGLLIRGREDMWEVINPAGSKEDFWDLVWYQSQLYVSSLRSLYVLRDDLLQRVDMGDAITTSCYQLSSCGRFLCSIGARAIGVFDGNSWKLIPTP